MTFLLKRCITCVVMSLPISGYCQPPIPQEATHQELCKAGLRWRTRREAEEALDYHVPYNVQGVTHNLLLFSQHVSRGPTNGKQQGWYFYRCLFQGHPMELVYSRIESAPSQGVVDAVRNFGWNILSNVHDFFFPKARDETAEQREIILQRAGLEAERSTVRRLLMTVGKKRAKQVRRQRALGLLMLGDAVPDAIAAERTGVEEAIAECDKEREELQSRLIILNDELSYSLMLI